MIRTVEKKFAYEWLVLSGAALVGAAAACSSDNTPVVNPPVDGSAGTGGTAGSGGSGGSGGGGGGSGGTAGSGGSTGGSAGSGGLDGSVSDAHAEAGKPKTLAVTMTKLTSDQAGVAANEDKSLVNGWGLAIKPDAPTGPIFWVADNGTGMATGYDQTGKPVPAIKVTIPVPADSGTSAPTGQVHNDSATAFMGDAFIFATEDGTIAGWKAGANATLRVDDSAANAIYKGLAIIQGAGGDAGDAGADMLATTDFHNGKVVLYDSTYKVISKAGAFTDATIPTGFAPFGVAFLGGTVYVTYAKQDADKKDDVKGAGNGFVDMFKPDGTGMKRLVSNGSLNAPWALAMAPSSFGALAGTLLVGNFGDGAIHAYDAATGAPVGDLVDGTGKPIAIDGLWAIEPGPKTATVDLSQTLFFTAGPNNESHGLFGKLEKK